MSIAERVKARLTQLGLTPITAATRAGLPRDTMRNMMRGRTSSVRSDTLQGVADALHTSAAYLMGETDDPGGLPEGTSIIAVRVSERIKALRTNGRATSEKAGLGADYVRDLLRGKVMAPSFERLSALADALDTTADYLMGRSDDPGPGAPPAPIIGSRTLMREAREALAEPPPIQMTVSADGSAHLRMDMKLPLDVAVEILALVKGKPDE